MVKIAAVLEEEEAYEEEQSPDLSMHGFIPAFPMPMRMSGVDPFFFLPRLCLGGSQIV